MKRLALALALGACEPARAPELAFTAAEVVFQLPGVTPRSVYVTEAPGGRLFAWVTATGSGGTAVWRSERVGGGWSAPLPLPRPPTTTEEEVLWSTSAPAAMVLTRGTGPSGVGLFVREHGGNVRNGVTNDWLGPQVVVPTGAEAPSRVGFAATRMPVARGRPPVHLVYAIPGGGCEDGYTLRHRGSAEPGAWSAFSTVAVVCGLESLALAAADGADGPLVAAWTARPPGGGERRVATATAPLSAPGQWSGWQFLVSSAVGEPEVVRLAALGGGAVLASWLPSLRPRRAAFGLRSTGQGFAFGATWFLTGAAPWIEPFGGEALAFGTESEAPAARLVVRRFEGASRSVASLSPVRAPLGEADNHRLLVTQDGAVHAFWIEAQAGLRRVLAASARSPSRDAGRD
ncbi:MAG: hypothetical protein HY909_26285 [Deltaproteobacteria bacterium]|nr:hypothetical protein [Deltaproteobacteria bacterium]